MRLAHLPAITLDRSNVAIWMAGVIAVLLAGILITSYDLWYECHYYVTTDDAQVAGSPQAIWITAQLEAVWLKDVRPGQTAVVHAGAAGRAYTGRVEEVAAVPATDAGLSGDGAGAKVRLPVKVVLEGSLKDLSPGEPAYVKIRVR